MTDKYPYYIYPDVVALKEGAATDEAEIMRHRRRIAANVGDQRTLRLILGIDPDEFANFYPDMAKPDLSTDDTIDSFLSQFCKEDTLLSAAVSEIPLPTPEPAQESDFSKIANNQRPTTKNEKPTPPNPQLLIKNHQYEAALEIIMAQSLNNPKKSIYFADQIRFLRKLILNESKK